MLQVDGYFRCEIWLQLVWLTWCSNGKHVHAPWTFDGKFATTREAHYPEPLRAKIASLVASSVAVVLQSQPDNSRALRTLVSVDRTGAAVQPRGTKAPPVMTEFKSVFFAPISCGSLTGVSALGQQTLKHGANLSGFTLTPLTRILQILPGKEVSGSAGTAYLVVPTRGTFSGWDMSDPNSLHIARHRDRRGVLHESP